MTLIVSKPKQALLAAALIGVSSFVVLNAVAFQTARHPAPLFASSREGSPTVLPPSRPVDLVASTAQASAVVAPEAGETIQTVSTDARSTSASPTQGPQAADISTISTASASGNPPRDPIAELIRTGPSSGSAQRQVMEGQRALDGLGYGPLTIDGILGPGTKRAIEAFERDRRLPVTGEFGPVTLKALAEQTRLSGR